MKKILFVLLGIIYLAPITVIASESEGVVNSTYRLAWSDKIGLIDMSNVKVLDDQLKGTASTVNMGVISFDDPSFKVKNDGAGNLSGSAYGAQTGLINFAGVKIGADGYFAGVADGSFTAGKIYFDCTGNSNCPNASSARVATDWRPVASRQQTAVVNTISQAASAKNYSACDGLNDYLSYSRCVSEVDAKRSQTTVLATEEPKSSDGAYSLKINNGLATTNKTTVSLQLTAPKEAVDMVVAKDNNFGFGAKQKVQSTIDWQLTDEAGQQAVYVKFYDQSGMPLKVLAASIVLDKRQGDAAAEKEAAKAFKALFGRAAGQSAADLEALKIMAYGMAVSVPRDLNKEKLALNKFVSFYKHEPIVEQEWNMIKAYAYAEEAAKLLKAGLVTSNQSNATPTVSTEVKSTVTQSITKDCRPKSVLTTNQDLGAKGQAVMALQESLKCQGLLAADYKVTGSYDQATELAVGAFQKANKILCADKTYCGALGPATRAKLNALAAIKTEVTSTALSTGAPTVTAEVKANEKKVNIALNRNLTLEMTGEDVTAVQKFLAADKAIYPEGLVTGKFGPMTEAAVKRWQAKYGLKCADGTACGYLGPASRKKLSELMAQ